MKHLLGEVDHQCLKHGQVRRVKTVQFARKNMVLAVLLENDSAYGVWGLTRHGLKAV